MCYIRRPDTDSDTDSETDTDFDFDFESLLLTTDSLGAGKVLPYYNSLILLAILF